MDTGIEFRYDGKGKGWIPESGSGMTDEEEKSMDTGIEPRNNGTSTGGVTGRQKTKSLDTGIKFRYDRERHGFRSRAPE